jgi:thiamine biosynthesis protein ThiS
MTERIEIVVNGHPRVVPAGLTVEGLIADLGLAGSICSAEINKRLVPRKDRAGRALEAGDHVEIVSLVGGG